MKLVRQVRLRSVQGTGTALYEVDLCEVGDDKFVVNFRYGKQGAQLTDGSKTVLPVTRDEAERVFNKLVQDKKRKGYVDAAAGDPETVVASESRTRSELWTRSADDARAAKLIGWLERPDTCRHDVPLHRVIWRAGELRLRAAAPALRGLLAHSHRSLGGEGEPPWQYGVVWALARCGDPATVPALEALILEPTMDPHVRRLATFAVHGLLEGDARTAFSRKQADALPVGVARALEETRDAVDEAVARYLADSGEDAYGVLQKLYLVDDPTARAALLDQLRALPLNKPSFRVLRHLFKAAEMLGDGEAFGILVWRFESTRANASPYWSSDKPTFGPGTRKWLRRRGWRTLRRLGQLGSAEFVDMAVGVLLAYGDEDRPLDGHWALGNLLYGARDKNYARLRVSAPTSSASAALRGREEAFPGLWDREPDALVGLMLRSRCEPVHVFASRALRANPKACEQLAMDLLLRLLGSAYTPTLELAAEIATRRYVPGRPDRELALAMARCALPQARKTAFLWIGANAGFFLADAGFAAHLATAPHHDAREFAIGLLQSAMLPAERAREVVARTIAELLANDGDEELAHDVRNLLRLAFRVEARTIGFAVIRDLVAHPSAGVQELGAALLRHHEAPAAMLPPDLLAAVMLSAHPQVRTIGVELFGRLPDQTLLERYSVVVDLCLNPHAEVRAAVRPIVGRLARSYPDFARSLTVALVDILDRREDQEGLHADIVGLISAELRTAARGLDVSTVWKLLQAPSSAAQELGGRLLGSNVDATDFELWRIAKLASHDVLSVRRAAWTMFETQAPRLKADMEAALTMLDATWEDSRRFAFDLFGRFSSTDFTPDLLISICDSVRPDVQQFGRGLITRFFDDADGPRYLVRLSQHPSTAMQLFATNYLERFAGGHADRVVQLRAYFTAVLTAVNRGRTAKARVLAFLREQAANDEGVARMVSEVLGDLALTISVEYRGAAIEILNEIRTRHPSVTVPLRLRVPPRRDQRAV